MALFAMVIEMVSRPTENQPNPSVWVFGLVPSIGYMVVAFMIFSEQFTRFA
jgi:nicotinamide riboside transporter PnuC